MQGTGVQIPPVPMIYVHMWTSAMSTRGRQRGLCAWTFEICFTNLYFWRCPRVDICKVHAWTSLSSRVVQGQGDVCILLRPATMTADEPMHDFVKRIWALVNQLSDL